MALAGCTGDPGTDATTDTSTDRGTTTDPAGATTTDTSDGTATAATETTDGTAETTTGEPSRETVEFPSRAGDAVVGTLWGAGDCAAVFAHGVGYDRSDWAPQARAVAAAGHAALAVDLDHDDRPGNVEALAGAVAYLRETVGVSSVVFVGASAGANAVVKTEADPGVDVAGLFVLAAGRAAEAAGDATGRSLFAVGARDGQRFRDTTRAMYENAPEPKRFETLDSAEHAQGIFGTPAGDRLHDLVVSFVDTVCEGS